MYILVDFLKQYSVIQILYPCISMPPVPWITSPVKYEPIGDARNRYAPATSMGIPGLCSGAASVPSPSIASVGLPLVAG